MFLDVISQTPVQDWGRYKKFAFILFLTQKNAFINPAMRVQSSICTLQCTRSCTATFSPLWAKHEHSVWCESEKNAKTWHFAFAGDGSRNQAKKCSKMSTKVSKKQENNVCFRVFYRFLGHPVYRIVKIQEKWNYCFFDYFF